MSNLLAKITTALAVATTSLAVSSQAISVDKTEGFVDINNPLSSEGALGVSTGMFRASGTSDQGTVGIALEVLPGWKEQRDGKFSVYWGHVELRRIGVESDNLIRLLIQKYALKSAIGGIKMVDQITMPAVVLEGDPLNPREGKLRMKLFYEGRTPETYAEVYANINNKTQTFEFHEKDVAYRIPLVSALNAAGK
jgi:hypothetical protein